MQPTLFRFSCVKQIAFRFLFVLLSLKIPVKHDNVRKRFRGVNTLHVAENVRMRAAGGRITGFFSRPFLPLIQHQQTSFSFPFASSLLLRLYFPPVSDWNRGIPSCFIMFCLLVVFLNVRRLRGFETNPQTHKAHSRRIQSCSGSCPVRSVSQWIICLG